MEVSHKNDILARPAAKRLRQFVRKRRQQWEVEEEVLDFEVFERELHKCVMALERELIAEELTRYDVDAEEVEVREETIGEVEETHAVGDHSPAEQGARVDCVGAEVPDQFAIAGFVVRGGVAIQLDPRPAANLDGVNAALVGERDVEPVAAGEVVVDPRAGAARAILPGRAVPAH